jgi:hypothetical protein
LNVDSHITRYSVMPIPPVDANTDYFDAGPVRIGVEYRLLNEAIAAAQTLAKARGGDPGPATVPEDRGVSIHVFALRGGQAWEHLRFDCFDEDPHYHYVNHAQSSNEMLRMDPIANGDSVAWALGCVRTRLPQMLERAGAGDVVPRLDLRALEAILPRVTEAAYRARYSHDDSAVLEAALAG